MPFFNCTTPNLQDGRQWESLNHFRVSKACPKRETETETERECVCVCLLAIHMLITYSHTHACTHKEHNSYIYGRRNHNT